MAATNPASIGYLARHISAGFLLPRSPRRYAQQVFFPRTPTSHIAVRNMPHPPSLNENARVLQIGVLGYRAPRQAAKLKKYLAEVDTDVRVKVAVEVDTRLAANIAGFTEESGTLGGMEETISGSNIVWLLLPGVTLEAPACERIFSRMKPHGILVVSDSSGRGHMQTLAVDNQKKIIALHVNPDDMGPFVRDLNIRAREINGAGTDFNSPVHQIPAFPGRTTMQNFGLFMLAFGAGALVTSAMDLAGGLSSMVRSFSALRNIAVSAMSLLSSFRKFQLTGAGSSTLPSDGTRSGSHHLASGMPHFTLNITGDKNNLNFYKDASLASLVTLIRGA